MTNYNPASTPSLLDAQPTKATPSMLSSLDAPEKKRQTKQAAPSNIRLKFLSILFILTAAGASTAALIANYYDTSDKPQATIPPVAATPAPTPALAPRLPAAPAPTVISQAATIITDTPNIAPAKAAPVTHTVTNEAHDRLNAALTRSETFPPHPQLAKPAKIADNKTAHAQTHPHQATAPAHKIKAGQGSAEESDVKLLAALVGSTKDVAVPPRKSASANGKHGTGNTHDSKRDRDIVERQSGDSTANLLQRCAKLGLIEGQLCRWRICSGRWDSDTACKSSTKSQDASMDNAAQ